MTPAADPVRAGSRDRVLAALRAASAATSLRDLCVETGLSPNAVRFHLDNLRRSGAVRSVSDPEHAAAGRPATLYTAAPAEGVESAAAYRTLAGTLAAELARTAGPKASTDAGRAWAAELMRGRDVTGRDPGAVVMELLDDGGFSPEMRADGSTVELHRCPFLDLALEQPAVVCGVHLGVVTGVLDTLGAVASVRLRPVLEGDGPCLVHLNLLAPPASQSAAVPTIEENAS